MLTYPLCHGDKGMVDPILCCECVNSYSCQETRNNQMINEKNMKIIEEKGVSVPLLVRRTKSWLNRSLKTPAKPIMNVRFLKFQCDCGATNYHPVFENKLIVNPAEERRCAFCGKVISTDALMSSYSKLQS